MKSWSVKEDNLPKHLLFYGKVYASECDVIGMPMHGLKSPGGGCIECRVVPSQCPFRHVCLCEGWLFHHGHQIREPVRNEHSLAFVARPLKDKKGLTQHQIQQNRTQLANLRSKDWRTHSSLQLGTDCLAQELVFMQKAIVLDNFFLFIICSHQKFCKIISVNCLSILAMRMNSPGWGNASQRDTMRGKHTHCPQI